MNKESEADLIARYFEQVLGVTEAPALSADSDVTDRCLFIEVSAGESAPSLREMAVNILEALRNEWRKHSKTSLPVFDWIQADQSSWQAAASTAAAGKALLVIVCGARKIPAEDNGVLHVASLAEMQSSHVVKLEAWRAMQRSVAAVIHRQN